MTERPLLTELANYGELQSMADSLRQASLEQLFTLEADRTTRMCSAAAGLRLDYSKQLLNAAALKALFGIAEQADLSSDIAELFAGAHLNNTEDRPALHTLLRASSGGSLAHEFKQVEAAREQMARWSNQLRDGQWKGFSGEVITDVVNIGIGGSDLGPRLVNDALRPYHGDVACHYVANVDPADLQNCLLDLSPESTLFIVCSKSFKTEETLSNSLLARTWLFNAGASDETIASHFVAVTSNLKAARDFGIPADHCLPMWDWVGGRYSVWSGIGLSCAIAVGWDRFREFLAGAEAMDNHFRSAAPVENMPLLCSLLELWNNHFLGAGNYVVLPYDNGLQALPAYLQQLTMESNGKRVSADGQDLPYHSGTVLWGSAGTMGQHSFHQLLHQGTELCPADFILPLTTHTGMQQQHKRLVANCLAQSRALMVGRSLEDARGALIARGMTDIQADKLSPHLSMPGNRPNNLITMKSLTPQTLGALLALYEHRTFCSARLWGINPFDQWGVELGKEIGVQVLQKLDDVDDENAMDASTEQHLAAWRHAQNPN